MAKYLVKVHEMTGKKGVKLYKGQTVDGKVFVDGSIDHWKSLGYIEETAGDAPVEKPKKGKKASEKEKVNPEGAE